MYLESQPSQLPFVSYNPVAFLYAIVALSLCCHSLLDPISSGFSPESATFCALPCKVNNKLYVTSVHPLSVFLGISRTKVELPGLELKCYNWHSGQDIPGNTPVEMT